MSDAEFAAMMKRLGVKEPKGGWGKKSTTNKSRTRNRTLSPAAKNQKDKLKALGPSRKEREKDALLHSPTKDLEEELSRRKNSPFKLRTDVFRAVSLPREIKERYLSQEAVGAKSGGKVYTSHNKRYSHGGKVSGRKATYKY